MQGRAAPALPALRESEARRGSGIACADTPEGGALNPTLFPDRNEDEFAVSSATQRVVLKAEGSLAANAERKAGKITYANAYYHTDLLYSISRDRIKEFLLVRDAAAPDLYSYRITKRDGVPEVVVQSEPYGLPRGQSRVADQQALRHRCHRKTTVKRRVVDRRRIRDPSGAACEPKGLTYPLLIDPSWSVRASMLYANAGAPAILLHNGKVLVAGGNMVRAELYDPDTGRVRHRIHERDAFGKHRNAAAQRQGLAGGRQLQHRAGAVTHSSAELYDPSTGVWTLTGSMSTTTRWSHGDTASQREGPCCRRFYLLTKWRWLVLAGPALRFMTLRREFGPSTGSMNLARTGHNAVLLSNGLVLVFGGAVLNLC